MFDPIFEIKWQLKEYRIRKKFKRIRQIANNGDVDELIRIINTIKNDDENHGIREEVIKLLGETRAPNAIRVLIGIIKNGQVSWERCCAIWALCRSENPQVVTILFEMIDDIKEYDIRDVLIVSLGEIGDKRVTPLLISALDNLASPPGYYFGLSSKQTKWKEQERLINALGQIGDITALPAIRRASREDDIWLSPDGHFENTNVISAAYSAIRKIIDKSESE